MKSFPFGKTPAAVRMENLVVENPSARRKVSRLLSRYTEQLLQTVGAKDPRTVRLLMELLCKYNLNRLDLMQIDTDVRTYAKNLVSGRYRVFLHRYNELVPIAQRQGKLLTSKKKGV